MPSRILNIYDETGELRRLDELRSQIIRTALRRYGGDLTKTAKALAIGRSTLNRWISGGGLTHYVEECRRTKAPSDEADASRKTAGPT